MGANNRAVAAAVWAWRESGGQTPANPVRRGRAAGEAAVMAGVGLLIAWRWHRLWLAAALWVLAGLVLAGGLFWPALYIGFKKAGAALGRGVGVALSWILLVPFFYVCFTLGRLFLMLRRRDPLQRAFVADLPSYWTPRRPPEDAARYRRQY